MKVVPCISGIQYLWVKLYELFAPNLRVDRDLPYEIIVDILSRLPAECVHLCGQECGILGALTRTPSFVAMHLSRRATPIIAFYHYQSCKEIDDSVREFNVSFTDIVAEKILSKTIKPDFSLTSPKRGFIPFLRGSYSGFLLFTSIDSYIYLLNPNTQEQVWVMAPSQGYIPHGLFLHPTTKEYNVLFVHLGRGDFDYILLNLKTKTSRLIARCSHAPSLSRPATIVNDVLHWIIGLSLSIVHGTPQCCTESILMFNIITEEVSTMGHPGRLCDREEHRKMKLIQKDNKLWFCNDILCGHIVIWILEDYENKCWVKAYDISLNLFYLFRRVQYTFEAEFCVEVLAFYEEVLLLRVSLKDLFLYNPHIGDTGVLRRIGESCREQIFRGVVVDHVDTLVSLDTDNLVCFMRDEIRYK